MSNDIVVAFQVAQDVLQVGPLSITPTTPQPDSLGVENVDQLQFGLFDATRLQLIGHAVFELTTPSGPAGGDLDGTYPDPEVEAFTTPDSTRLAFDDIADGEYLRRSAALIIGIAPANVLATATAAIDVNAQKITDVADPTADQDAATKAYVDAAPGGGATAVAVADSNIAITGLATAIDGVALIAADRVLLTGQTDPVENGLWVAAAGAWSRPTDWTGTVDSGTSVATSSEGTNYASTMWVLATDDVVTVDTTAVTIIRLALPETKRMYTFPVGNPIPGDDVPRFYVERAFRVEEIRALKIGGTGTFGWELRHSVDATDQGAGTLIESDTGVNNETTGVSYTPPFLPGNPTVIPAGNWVWLELPTVSTGISRPVAILVQMIGVELGP